MTKKGNRYSPIAEDYKVFDWVTGETLERIKIVNRLNEQDKIIERLRKDNLQSYGLLGDIRALLRLGDTDAVIEKINRFEKEITQ